MKSWEVVAWAKDGEVYCPDCAQEFGLPESLAAQEDSEWCPVFASDEWDHWPTCTGCLGTIYEVNMIGEEEEEEVER